MRKPLGDELHLPSRSQLDQGLALNRQYRQLQGSPLHSKHKKCKQQDPSKLSLSKILEIVCLQNLDLPLLLLPLQTSQLYVPLPLRSQHQPLVFHQSRLQVKSDSRSLDFPRNLLDPLLLLHLRYHLLLPSLPEAHHGYNQSLALNPFKHLRSIRNLLLLISSPQSNLRHNQRSRDYLRNSSHDYRPPFKPNQTSNQTLSIQLLHKSFDLLRTLPSTSSYRASHFRSP